MTRQSALVSSVVALVFLVGEVTVLAQDPSQAAGEDVQAKVDNSQLADQIKTLQEQLKTWQTAMDERMKAVEQRLDPQKPAVSGVGQPAVGQNGTKQPEKNTVADPTPKELADRIAVLERGFGQIQGDLPRVLDGINDLRRGRNTDRATAKRNGNGVLRVANLTSKVQHLWVNDVEKLIPAASETLLEVPLGTLTYRLSHEPKRIRTIAEPGEEVTTQITANAAVRAVPIVREVWDPFLRGWVRVWDY